MMTPLSPTTRRQLKLVDDSQPSRPRSSSLKETKTEAEPHYIRPRALSLKEKAIKDGEYFTASKAIVKCARELELDFSNKTIGTRRSYSIDLWDITNKYVEITDKVFPAKFKVDKLADFSPLNFIPDPKSAKEINKESAIEDVFISLPPLVGKERIEYNLAIIKQFNDDNAAKRGMVFVWTRIEPPSGYFASLPGKLIDDKPDLAGDFFDLFKEATLSNGKSSGFKSPGEKACPVELKSQHTGSGSWRILGWWKDEPFYFDKGEELIMDDDETTMGRFDLLLFSEWYHKNG